MTAIDGRGQHRLLLLALFFLFLPVPGALAMREVRVGTYDEPPLVSLDAKGAPVGIFADIIADIARQEGLKLTYVHGSWAENLRWVKEGKIDLILAVGMARGKAGEVSVNKQPVFFSWTQVFTAKSTKAESLLDLDGKRVAGLRADLNLDLFKNLATEIGIRPEYVEVDDIEQAFQFLSQGKVAAVVTERAAGRYFEKKYPINVTPFVFSPRVFVFGTTRGKNLDLLDMIDRHILAERGNPDSTYQKILKQWGETEPFQIPPYIPWIFGPAVSLLILSVGGNMLLKRQVRRKTEELSNRNQSLEEEVAERQRIQDSLKQAKEAAEAANQAKDQFIATLSHELRTPLMPVLASVTDFEKGGTPGLPQADVELIRRNVELEARLIDDLLDVTQIRLGKIALNLEPTDIHACLEMALAVCRREIEAKRQAVSLELAATRHHLRGDPARLQQVFWNLLKNAVKFTPENGRISIRTANNDDRLAIEIADTGIGIEPEVMPRIFKVFEQGEKTKSRHFGGLGLGLHIAKTIVEMHHGSIACFSEGEEKGTTFTVEFAVSAGEAAASAPLAPPVPETGASRRILLVDDHADTLHTMARLLQRWGYSVTTADCVRSALAAASKEPFDLLVSDVGLPDGSGLDIMREVRNLYGLRGIALSGFGTEDDIRQSKSAGFEAHLVKPVSSHALRTAIARVAAEAS
ncbi:MAG: ATP-binding protein [Chthoniobacteraceae bacterium]|nr:ATP-binding protein [Chthoniobacteraceae bacterium]